VVDTELGGDGADLPVLGEVEATNPREQLSVDHPPHDVAGRASAGRLGPLWQDRYRRRAANIANAAILAGHSVLFITAAQMLLDLSSQESARALERRLRHYQRFALLVVDEIGYLSYDNRNADLFFQVVSRRYEQKSIVLTTNLAFSDWKSIFPNATSATALIDRLCHHADILKIEGDSYRRREAEAGSKSRRKSRKKKSP
jgi:hypothetical protein